MENKITIIDLQKMLPQLKEILEENLEFPMLITGNSMNPFLVHLRDTIYISKPDQVLKKGDMVFYTRKSGQCVMHRIHHVDQKGRFYMVGDAHKEIEGPIEKEQIFGQIKKVIRKGKTLTKKDKEWRFFEKIWIRVIPFRGYLKRGYCIFRKLRKEGH